MTGATLEEYQDKMFIVDKRVGPTSFDVVTAFRKATHVRKVGHAGTLDPLAEGVLLICSGVATRAVEHFMNLEKEYEFDVYLGVETTTLDAEGTVVREAPCPDIPQAQILETARSFVGDYDLEPPVFSALKRDGKRLYELARNGEVPGVGRRRVRIYDMQVLAVDLPTVRCRVRCSRGTYVRSLARDFGARLELPAHIRQIVRRRVGHFRQEGAFTSERLFDRDLSGLQGLSLNEALSFLPAAVLEERAGKGLRYGMLPGTRDVVRTIGELGPHGPVRMLDQSGGLLAVGQRNEGKRRNPLQLVDTYRMFVDTAAAKGWGAPGKQ